MTKTKMGGIARTLAVLLTLLLTVTGCSVLRIRRIDPTSKPGTGVAETAAPETEAPETEAPETEAPETEEPETVPPLPENVRVYTEEEFFTPAAERLSTLNLPFRPGCVSNIEDGKLLVGCSWDSATDIDLALVDLDSLTVTTGTYAFEDSGEEMYYGYSLFLMNGTPVVFDRSRNAICTLDESLNPGVRSPLPTNSAYDLTRISGDRFALESNTTDFMGAVLEEDGTFSFADLPITRPAGFDDVDVYAALDENRWLVSCLSSETYDYCSGIYDAGSAIVTPFRNGSGNMNLCGGRLIESDYKTGQIRVYDPARPEAYLAIMMPDSYYLSYSVNGAQYLYVTNSGEGFSSVLRYDPETGERVDELSVPVPEGVWGYTYGFLDYGGDVYFYNETGDNLALCRWEAEEEGGGHTGFDLLLREDEAGSNEALISELYEKYGVTVYTGTDAVRYMYGYAVLPETDEEKVRDALLLLKDFFDHTPEGFMQEVVSCYSSLDICLTGRIIPELGNRNSISDATAFTTETNGIELAVFDINQGGMDKTVAHEFMHVFENTAYHLSWESDRDFELFGRWSMLNPPDFEYRYVYTDEEGNTYNWDDNGLNGQFWTEGGDPDGIYFVDGYSMTYPTEDMARIFENTAMRWKYDLPGYFAGKNMQLKAAYLAACLRDAFASITDDTVCVWEEGLDPGCTLEWFRENYDVETWMEEHAKG